MALLNQNQRLLMTCLLALMPELLFAGTGAVLSMPQGNKRPKHGLRVNVDVRWVDANGYHPVSIELVNWPPGPAKADRSFRIVLRPQSHYGNDSHGVTGYAELPQGARSATTTISVPQRGSWSNLHLTVYEDGRYLDDLSDYIGIPNRGYYEWTEALPSVLIIDVDAPDRNQRERIVQQTQFRRNRQLQPRQLPDLRGLGAFFPPPEHYDTSGLLQMDQDIDDADTLRIVSQLPRHALLPLFELPDKWIDYTCFDVGFISMQDLGTLKATEPERYAALLEWARAGQTLCVSGVDLDQLGTLEKLLDCPLQTADTDSPTAFPGWTPHKPTGNSDRNIKGLENSYNNQTYRHELINQWSRSQKDTGQAGVAFLSRPLGLGRVFAMETDEPFMATSFPLPLLFNEIGRENWMWYQRHGFSMYRDNDNYWNFMIPGVGRAPVNSYLVLITLFVIVIGPVNYAVLRRRKRLYLLLVTVPGGAGLVTFALMNYALISDGLGVRVRIRSFTHLDQTNDQSATWSRHSYYAGLAPSRGLTFPDHAAFYPIHQFPSDRSATRTDRMLVWEDDQRLTSGYLTSRSSAQFMVVTAETSQLELTVTETGSAPAVENRLGTDIRELYLCDSQGQYFRAKSIAAGDAAQLSLTDGASIELAYRVELSANQPDFPEGYDAQYYRNSFGFRRNYYYGWSNVDNGLPAPMFRLGLLERNLGQAIATGNRPELEPRSYVAIVESSPLVPIGYQRSREEASFHVIAGRW